MSPTIAATSTEFTTRATMLATAAGPRRAVPTEARATHDPSPETAPAASPDIAAAPTMSAADARMVAALLAGDESAFAELIDRHHAALVRLARAYVNDAAAAEDVVQETWISVMRGLRGFEGRSSLKNWIFGILVNRARTRATRESRTLVFSSMHAGDAETAEAATDPATIERDATAHGRWMSLSDCRDGVPEQACLSSEMRARIQTAVDALPVGQRRVLILRDVEGWGPQEVTHLLGISGPTQRVILHRARTRLRQALAPYLR